MTGWIIFAAWFLVALSFWVILYKLLQGVFALIWEFLRMLR